MGGRGHESAVKVPIPARTTRARTVASRYRLGFGSLWDRLREGYARVCDASKRDSNEERKTNRYIERVRSEGEEEEWWGRKEGGEGREGLG